MPNPTAKHSPQPKSLSESVLQESATLHNTEDGTTATKRSWHTLTLSKDVLAKYAGCMRQAGFRNDNDFLTFLLTTAFTKIKEMEHAALSPAKNRHSPSRYELPNVVTGESASDSSFLNTPLLKETHNASDKLKAKHSKERFFNELQARPSGQEHTMKAEPQLKCDRCGKSALTQAELLSHDKICQLLAKYHKQPVVPSLMAHSACPWCLHKCADKQTYVKHVFEQHCGQKTYLKCVNCKHAYTNMADLVQHHKKESTCSTCSKNLLTKHRLQRHMKVVHRIGRYVKPKCDTRISADIKSNRDPDVLEVRLPSALIDQSDIADVKLHDTARRYPVLLRPFMKGKSLS